MVVGRHDAAFVGVYPDELPKWERRACNRIALWAERDTVKGVGTTFGRYEIVFSEQSGMKAMVEEIFI